MPHSVIRIGARYETGLACREAAISLTAIPRYARACAGAAPAPGRSRALVLAALVRLGYGKASSFSSSPGLTG